MKIFSKVFLSVSMIAIGGCASVPKLPLSLQPQFSGEKVKLTGSEQVAVLEFNGRSGDQAASTQIVNSLTTEFGKIKRFKLVERSQVDKLMQELSLGLTGIIETKDVQELGKMLMADMVITGDISRFEAKTENFKYTYSSEKGQLFPLPPSPNGNIVGVPSEERSYNVQKYTAAVNFGVRMIKVATGEIIWSKQITKSFSMNEKEYPFSSAQEIADYLLNIAVQEIVDPFKE